MKAIEKALERMIEKTLGEVTAEEVETTEIKGCHIVVLDRGWVYVGNVIVNGEFVTITNARNIRKWGTRSGLGQLSDGPTSETVLDDVGQIIAPLRAVIHFIKCTRDW